MSESNGTTACTACCWHRRIPAPHDNAGLHVCIHPAVRTAMPNDVIASEAGKPLYVNCDLARRMGAACGPRGDEWTSPEDASAWVESLAQDGSLEPARIAALEAEMKGVSQVDN